MGDKLVIYTPIYLSDIDPDTPLNWPLIRRWSDKPASKDRWASASLRRQISYKPVAVPTLAPAIHTISTCDLGPKQSGGRTSHAGRRLSSNGPSQHTFYVSPDDVYVWVPTSDNLDEETCRQ